MKNLFCIFILIPVILFAQEETKAKKWDVNKITKESKAIEISTSEGTWMNLDVSPDGKQIVFGMLGDIYTMPITGGEAKLIRGGKAYEVQPRFSPNGKQISFTSDAGGGDNIWTMNSDGSNAKQVTKESFRLLNNAIWTPDGEYLIARKHFTSRRSLGAGEMWLYHKSGGKGVQLTKRKNDQQDAGEPCISPNGRYLYYSEDMYPGGKFSYNKDPNNQIYVIKRYDREKGILENFISGPGGSFRPQISRDGKKLAFVRRVRTKTVLFTYDFKTGAEKPVYDNLSKDQQEAWAIFGIYTNFNWLPDNIHVVIWSKGKIWKINTNTSLATEIPFKATAKHNIAEAIKVKQNIDTDYFTSKMIRHAVTSPDEKLLVFNAAGYLYQKVLPNGTPTRLTKSTNFEFEPSFSSDGKYLVYVTWSDLNKGSIIKREVKSGKEVKLTKEKGIYREPRFSNNGLKIVYRKERGNDHQGFDFCVEPGIYTMSASGSNTKFIIKEGSKPSFNKNDTRIFYLGGEKKAGQHIQAYKSINLAGNDKQTHFTSTYSIDFIPSHDNKWIAFQELHKVYVAAFPQIGKAIDLSAKMKSLPMANFTRDAGINVHWSKDDSRINWTLGDEYYSVNLNERFKFLKGAPDSLPPLDTVGIKIGLQLKTDKPSGMLALKGARIITMNSTMEVIEAGTIITENNKIKSIGKISEMQIPAGVKIIDVKGKTIIPGLVDVHAHLKTFRQGLSPQKHWPYFANLAYGVTTTHDPSSNTEMVFSQSEMVKSGTMIGPRIFSTGTIIYGADGLFKAVINSLDDARSAIRRTKAFGAFSIKSYNQPRREQRQQIIQAAKELNIMVYPEGGSTFFHNLSMVIDGHTGVEHCIPINPAYDDVVKLWSASKTGYTPTLVVGYGAVSGEYYWYQHTNVWEKELLLKYTPRSIIDTRSRHRLKIPEEEYENGHFLIAQTCKKFDDAGIGVNLGGHGQLQGLGAHWELWMLGQGGMSNMNVLKSATMSGAKYIGMEHAIGSLEVGKLADLVVLDKNPLENIRNTEFVKYTMINGRLYDVNTMNEIGNYDNKRGKFYWENLGYGESFQWHESGHGHEYGECSCGIH